MKSGRSSLSALFKLIQVGVGCRVAQFPTHGNDLAFVMKGVTHNMMENECGSTGGLVSVGEMKFRICVELLIRQVR